MRAGIDGLSVRIQNTLGRSPCDGSAYAFCNRRRNRLKLLVWDGTGWGCVSGGFIVVTSAGPVPKPRCVIWQWLTTGVDDQAQEEALKALAEVRRLAEQITRCDTALHAGRTKIQALTLELAHAAPDAFRRAQ